MATIVLDRGAQAQALPRSWLGKYNLSSIISAILAAVFVSYFVIPHTGVLSPLFHLSLVYVVVVPLAAFILSIIGLRQIYRTNDRGIVMGTIALVVTSLYFMVALATPIVLLGCYIVYVYVLR